MATKKITVEVEVPSDMEEDLFRRILVKEARRIAKLITEWEDRMVERQPKPEEEALLREIKREVARRAEMG